MIYNDKVENIGAYQRGCILSARDMFDDGKEQRGIHQQVELVKYLL